MENLPPTATLNISIIQDAKKTIGYTKYIFTKLFETWLWFERYIVYPCVYIKDRVKLGINWSGIPKQSFPRWALRNSKHCFSLRLFRWLVEKFWISCFAPSLPFRIVHEEGFGLSILSKTNSHKRFIENLVGLAEIIDSDEMWEELLRRRYNCMIDCSKRHLLFGPMQYLNHQCKSSLGFMFGTYEPIWRWDGLYKKGDKGRLFKADRYHIRYEFEGFEGLGFQLPNPIVANEYVYVQYSFQKHDTSVFVCACVHCAGGSKITGKKRNL